MPLKLTTYYRGSKVPVLPGTNTFHSTELFRIYEETPGIPPYSLWHPKMTSPLRNCLPPYVKVSACFHPASSKDVRCTVRENISITRQTKRLSSVTCCKGLPMKHCAILFSSSSATWKNAMFGYKSFRDNQYIAINWLRVRNSLHSVEKVEERFSPSRIRQIKKGLKNGAQVREARTKEEILCFAQMLRHVYSSKIRRHFPSIKFFQHLENQLTKGQQSKIFIVIYKEKIIGGSACIYSDDSAYLWFSGGMRKTYALQYPGILAVWKALDDAKQRGYRHLEFMDVGLPS